MFAFSQFSDNNCYIKRNNYYNKCFSNKIQGEGEGEEQPDGESEHEGSELND